MARAYGTLYVSEDTMIVSYDNQTNTVSVFTDDGLVKIKPRQNVKVMKSNEETGCFIRSDPTILIIGETVFKNVELSEEFDEMLELLNGKIVMGNYEPCGGYAQSSSFDFDALCDEYDDEEPCDPIPVPVEQEP